MHLILSRKIILGNFPDLEISGIRRTYSSTQTQVLFRDVLAGKVEISLKWNLN